MLVAAVLFDLDGTLLDTLDDLADAMNATLAELGRPGWPREAYKRFVGDGIYTLARRVLPADAQDEATLAACVAGMRVQYAARHGAKTRPYDGIVELLGTLSAAGVRLAVFSNKPDADVQQVVPAQLPGVAFEVLLGQRDGVPVKPDPAGALEVAQRLGLAPADSAYVGDTDTDMRCAVAAGMYPIGAAWGFRDAAELWACGARAVADSPRHVVELLAAPLVDRGPDRNL